jgi:phosphoglucosamine mutase
MLEINPEIFKAYDIRGVYGKDFDNELAYLIGLAYVSLRLSDKDINKDEPLTVAVAHDMRLSSPILKEALIRGLRTAGANVVDLGLIATPSFYFAVGEYNYDGGVMISASHNPFDDNGIKLFRSDGYKLSDSIEAEIEQLIDSDMLEKLSRGRDIGRADRDEAAQTRYIGCGRRAAFHLLLWI